MKSFNIEKLITNVAALQSTLVDNGFSGAIVQSVFEATPPYVIIYVDDSADDPSDFIDSYQDQPLISATSNRPMGPFGHYQADADGIDKHIVTIQMLDGEEQLVDWDGNILVQPLSPVTISTNTVIITNGTGTFEVGPTSLPGEYDLYLQVQGDSEGWSRHRLHLSFF